jgi:hypothetical protein
MKSWVDVQMETPEVVRAFAEEAYAEVLRLAGENVRLRAALVNMLETQQSTSGEGDRHRDQARAALRETGS